jgi:hypothetical protein
MTIIITISIHTLHAGLFISNIKLGFLRNADGVYSIGDYMIMKMLADFGVVILVVY